jgi:hypothetical protein
MPLWRRNMDAAHCAVDGSQSAKNESIAIAGSTVVEPSAWSRMYRWYPAGRQQVEQTLRGIRHERAEVDQIARPWIELRFRDHDTPVGMPDHHYVSSDVGEGCTGCVGVVGNRAEHRRVAAVTRAVQP